MRHGVFLALVACLSLAGGHAQGQESRPGAPDEAVDREIEALSTNAELSKSVNRLTSDRTRFRAIQDAPPDAGASQEAGAQSGGADDLSKQLANPVASLISVPFQSNFDFGFAGGGWRYTLNMQPVIPISLNERWNLISRTIVPFIHQEDVIGSSTQTGLGDTTESLFLSPAKPSKLVWGLGPIFLLPSATDDLLGSEKWGAGPTGLLLLQEGKWTFGALVNHIWSFAGDEDRAEVNSTFLQPFIVLQLGKGQSVSLNTESTYNWVDEQWTVPINLAYSKVTKIGSQTFSFGLGGRYYAEAPEGGPDWGIRLIVTLLFPK